MIDELRQLHSLLHGHSAEELWAATTIKAITYFVSRHTGFFELCATDNIKTETEKTCQMGLTEHGCVGLHVIS
jgi:hypothetical protein